MDEFHYWEPGLSPQERSNPKIAKKNIIDKYKKKHKCEKWELILTNLSSDRGGGMIIDIRCQSVLSGQPKPTQLSIAPLHKSAKLLHKSAKSRSW